MNPENPLTISRPNLNEWLIIGFTFFSLFVFYSAWMAHYPYLIDDAFITFRFSQNLANGHGLVWNIGEEAVEGYSSPLMLLAMVPSFWLGIEATLYARILCILCNVIAIPVMLFWMIRRLPWSRDSGFRLTACLLPGTWLISHSTLIHTISGMETALACATYLAYAIIIGLTIDSSKNTGSTGLKYMVLVVIFSLLVFLVRSEGGALACLGFATLFLYSQTRKFSIIAGVIFFAFLGFYLLWKHYYFGYLLPTPYYHKMVDKADTLPGLYSVWAFLNHHLALSILITVGWIISPPSFRNRLHPFEIISLSGFLFYSLFFLRVEHIMGYDFRFNWTTMPLLLVLGIYALWRVNERFTINPVEPDESSKLSRFSPHIEAGGKILAIGAFTVLMLMRLPTLDTIFAIRYFTNPPLATWLRDNDGRMPHQDIGDILGDLELSYDTTVVGMEAGIIPFYAGTRTNDIVGLTSVVFTHGTEEERAAYLEKYPYDVNFSVSTTGALDDLAVELYWAETDPEGVARYSREYFLENMVGYYYAGTYFWAPDPRRQYFNMWVRKAHPRAIEIATALREGATTIQPDFIRFGPYDEGIIEGLNWTGQASTEVPIEPID